MPEGLAVKNCSVKYPGVETAALSRLSFELPRGSFFVLAGSSGSGKTTLLKAIAGLTDLNEGIITWDGEKVKGPAASLVPGNPRIKLINQSLELQEKMTVEGNLKHALRAFTEPYRSERIAELLKLCKLKGLEGRLPEQLSGGQRQRVVWATMLADEPELLLLDEPFSQLDPVLRTELADVLKEIQREWQVTMLLVTHDPPEALALAEKIVLLNGGRLEMVDLPQIIYSRPISEYAASFFGEANFFTSKELIDLGLQKEEMPANGKWLLRPENVVLRKTGNGIETWVVDCQFKGFYYLATLQTKDGKLFKSIIKQHLKTGLKKIIKLAVADFHLLTVL